MHPEHETININPRDRTARNYGSWSDFAVTKSRMNFYMKNIFYVGHKTHLRRYKKAFLKSLEIRLIIKIFVNFLTHGPGSAFPGRIQIQGAKSVQIYADPDPKHLS